MSFRLTMYKAPDGGLEAENTYYLTLCDHDKSVSVHSYCNTPPPTPEKVGTNYVKGASYNRWRLGIEEIR
jgi:hypothetical protein